ncbi:MAG: hypothetical protein ACLFVR_14985 [Thiohalospira sp.]
MDYEKDVHINENDLDLECLEQPSLMLKYSKHLEYLKKERDRIKEKVDLVRAGLDKDIRTTPEDFDIYGKITEAVVSAAILIQPEYKKVMEEYLNAKYEAGVAQGVVSAIDARKTMLELLVKLHGQSYFAGPRVPRDLSQEREKSQKKIDGGISQKMKRKK